jgi:nitrite reductase (NADH) large subunit
MTVYRIIGNGAAGTTAAEQIRKRDAKGNISIITDENLPFYWRIRLPDYVAGEVSEEALLAKKESWYRDQDIELKLGTRITDADPKEKHIVTDGGEILPYDYLLVATGSHSFIPPIQGSDKEGVFALRSVQDARNIISWAGGGEEVILIGGGLLGLEAGNALRKLGKRVMVVEFFPRLLPRQLDTDGAKRLQEMMEKMGFSFRLGAKTQEITGEGKVNGVKLESGEFLPGSMVIISAGVRPNLELVEPLGLDHDKGIQVDDRLRTNQEGVYAAGDVAEFNGIPYGIWPAALDQGRIAGTNMAGGDLVYPGTTMATSLKVVGIDLASAGNIDAENELDAKVRSDESVFKKIVLEGNRIAGCIMLGDTAGFNKVTQAMSQKKDVSRIKDELLTEGFDWNAL